MTDHSEAVRQTHADSVAARKAFFAAIRAALAAGVTVSQVARDSGFTREYITKIRDGKGPKDV
jgi:DNA-binding phage protein